VACEHGKLVLEKVGITVDTALSGPEGIDKIELRRGRRNPYDLILVDWKMPEIDGIETSRRIRSVVGEETAIIILTAYKWDDIYDEAVNTGVDSFISKPLFAANVLDEFERAVKRKKTVKTVKNEDIDFTGKNILLAEDVDINAEIMKMILEARGINVDIAHNGKEAVELFETKPENHYLAVLMDMRMPEMDGLTATKIIRNTDRNDSKKIPILALTANAFDEDVQRSLQAGLNAHLTKPVDAELLFETLGSFM
jgi:CheY-like chemotaxis protein